MWKCNKTSMLCTALYYPATLQRRCHNVMTIKWHFTSQRNYNVMTTLWNYIRILVVPLKIIRYPATLLQCYRNVLRHSPSRYSVFRSAHTSPLPILQAELRFPLRSRRRDLWREKVVLRIPLKWHLTSQRNYNVATTLWNYLRIIVRIFEEM